jgi:hypothetical protein
MEACLVARCCTVRVSTSFRMLVHFTSFCVGTDWSMHPLNRDIMMYLVSLIRDIMMDAKANAFAMAQPICEDTVFVTDRGSSVVR